MIIVKADVSSFSAPLSSIHIMHSTTGFKRPATPRYAARMRLIPAASLTGTWVEGSHH